MEKLELKHLAPYLPYGLKYLQSLSNTVLTLKPANCEYLLQTGDKPLLLPLSHLKAFDIKIYMEVQKLKMHNIVKTRNLPFWVHNILCENHFDVFGLIDAGLALNKNDYPNHTDTK